MLTTALCCFHCARTSVLKSSNTDGESAFVAAFSCLLACLFVCFKTAIFLAEALYLHQYLLCLCCCHISSEDATAPLPWDSQQGRVPQPAATKHTSHSLCLLPLMCCCSTPSKPIEAAIVSNSTELSKKVVFTSRIHTVILFE